MKSGGDKDGEALDATTYGDGTKSGAANALNQYTAINNRSTFDITGTDPDAASVTISNPGSTPSVEAQPESTSPKQRFRFNVPSASTTTDPSWNNVTVNGSTSGTKTGSHYLPSLEEQPQYDKDGNLKEDARWTYKWNGENRLIEMETTTAAATAGVPKQKLQFTYDYIGRRIQKKVYDWNPTTSAYETTPSLHQKFIYDGWNLILRINAATNTPDQKYYWGTDLSGTEQGAGGVGGLLFTQVPGSPTKTYTPTYDGNGNVITQVNATTGSPEARYEYDGFGNVIQKLGDFADANLFQFSTKYMETETGFAYFGYRYYHSALGRWISRDPIKENGGVNLVGILRNNCIGQIDVLGNGSLLTLIRDSFMERRFRTYNSPLNLILQDFFYEMDRATKSARLSSIRAYAVSEIMKISTKEWTVLKPNNQSSRKLGEKFIYPKIGKGIQYNELGFWLHEAHDVRFSGTIETCLRSDGGLKFGKIDLVWKWVDAIDIRADRNDGVVQWVAESSGGFLEYLTHSEFGIEITFKPLDPDKF